MGFQSRKGFVLDWAEEKGQQFFFSQGGGGVLKNATFVISALQNYSASSGLGIKPLSEFIETNSELVVRHATFDKSMQDHCRKPVTFLPLAGRGKCPWVARLGCPWGWCLRLGFCFRPLSHLQCSRVFLRVRQATCSISLPSESVLMLPEGCCARVPEFFLRKPEVLLEAIPKALERF